MNRVEIESSLQALEKEYAKLADIFYEFRKCTDVADYDIHKEEYLKQLIILEDKISEKRRALNVLVGQVNKTCSRLRCAQCINHNKCDMEYD